MDPRFPLTPAVRRLLVISGILTFAGAFVADMAELSKSPAPHAPAAWLPLLVAGPLTGLATLERLWSPSLGRRVAVVAAVSLALTAWSLFRPVGTIQLGVQEIFGLLFLIFRTTTHRARPAVAAALTIPLVVVALLVPLRNSRWPEIIAGEYLMTVTVAISISIGCAIRALETRKEHTVREARQAERLALARDLHDLVAHHMTGIIVQANAALTIHAAAPDRVDPILRNIVDAGTETLESTRRLVRVLREDDHVAVRPGALLAELSELVAAHSSASDGAEATARLQATAAARTARLSPKSEIAVHRLVQEALTNVRRHAPGAQTVVHVDAVPDRVRVSVTNSPAPRTATRPLGGHGGYGLLGLRERVEALDGTLYSGPLPDGGWQVEAALPVAVRPRPDIPTSSAGPGNPGLPGPGGDLHPITGTEFGLDPA
ncbi:histidine kinase [Streptomyces mirabilis]|nr:histidine kinase [Streptomyces mirabilis]